MGRASIYAEEGTFMHELAELNLALYLERDIKARNLIKTSTNERK